MTTGRATKLVLLGMMGRLRVGGGIWQTMHYLVGLQKLGYEPYYIEAHGCLPWAFPNDEAAVAAFIDSIMRRFDMSGRWAFHARGGSGAYYGMTEFQVKTLYESAAAILNLHGGTVPTDEHSASGRLVYIDTDPVTVQMDIHNNVQSALDVLDRHSALFTFAENYGNSDCKLPASTRFRFKPTRQPVVLDFWGSGHVPTTDVFTTIGNWKQLRRVIEYDGEEYYWSKHLEFLRFLELPARARQTFELALSGCDNEERTLLAVNGWKVRDAFSFSHDLDAYRQYILQSKGEFTVAKDQNIRFRTGWFSDRSATYLAAGRPVITQDTGFSNILPTGEGLFGFSELDDVVAAAESICTDYESHRRAAECIAREYFAHDIVLTRLLSEIGVSRPPAAQGSSANAVSVNLVGDFSSNTGMRATAEAYRRALDSAGVCASVFDTSDISSIARCIDRDADINLICCEVASHFSLSSSLGKDFFRNRYNIGIWVWESPTFPKKWYDRFAYYDEIWAPTSFVASALSPVSPIPVVRIPFVLEQKRTGSRSNGRGRLNMRDEHFVYLFIFNFYSRCERKNSTALVHSFKRAFQSTDSARLIIKCANADFNREHFLEMQREAEGYPIAIYDGQWTDQEMSDLMAACDCYVSLHRSEGVGVTISDAMSAGKPVIATGWSGNMDFMTVSTSFPVRYRLVELERDVAQYRAGDIWAEPSIDHAAELMRYVFENRDEAIRRGEAARSAIQSAYSSEAVGALISRRLAVIRSRKRFATLKDFIKDGTELDLGLTQFADLGDYVPAKQSRYQQLKTELRHICQSRVPAGATVAIVSKGDDELVNLDNRQAWHFPQDAQYRYAGHHPKDSEEAINLLEAVRARGGEYLVFPSTAFWWFDHYAEFHEHLLTRYKVAHRDESCVMFELRSARYDPS